MSKKQIGKRLLQILIVLIGVSFFTFGLTYLSPGDPAEIMLTECGNLPTPELLEQTRHELGLDQPFLVQYGSWVKGVLTGDMGTSYAFKVPVTEKLMKCFWPTLQMSLFALLLMILFSIPCGILSAVYQNKWPDYLIRGITFFGVSVPSFWIGLILLSIFGVQLRWINVAGGTTDFKAMILPAVTLALSMSAKYTRQVRNAVLEELRQDYVIGARMRGIKESVILWRHVLPNAMLPIVTLLGLSLGSLLGGTAVVEIIYNWPGMGSMAIKAIACRDYPMVQAYVLMIAVMYMVINIKLDCVSYETLLDRRDSSQYDLLIWNVLVANTGDPENYLRENWYSTSANNTSGYANKDVDAWLDELAETIDTDARKELIAKIQQAIMDDAATVFFGYENTFLISKSTVEGLVMYPMDYYWVTADMKMAE